MSNKRKWLSILILFGVLLTLTPSCGPGQDATEKVAEQFMQAIIANDMATLQEVVDPDCQEEVLSAIFVQMGFMGMIGGGQAEYTELQVQTTDKDRQRATVHVSGKLKVQALGTQMIAPVEEDLPLVKKDGQWYIACDYASTER